MKAIQGIRELYLSGEKLSAGSKQRKTLWKKLKLTNLMPNFHLTPIYKPVLLLKTLALTFIGNLPLLHK
ncbi:hypothetical protein CEXT_356061, partial [Caerostris extrusa]